MNPVSTAFRNERRSYRTVRRRTDKEGDIYRQIVSQVADYAIIRLDLEGRIETWNTGARNIKGYTEDEILGEDFRRFYTRQDREAGLPDRLLAIARQEGRVNDEGWRVRRNGELFWASLTITALRDDSGELVGYSKVTRDLTERRAAEEKLRASEERYQKMVAEVRDYAIILLSPGGDIQTWNSGAEHIKGYSADEIIGGNFRCFYPRSDLDANKPERMLSQALSEGRAMDEGWRVRKDGSRFFASVTLTALHGDEGQIIGFSKVTRDLTERHKAEERIRRSEERYHRMIEEVTDYAILSLDCDGIVQTWNQGAEAIKGYSEAEIVGQSFRRFYTAQDQARGRPDELLRLALSSGRAQEEGWRVRKDGSEFWASVTLTALHDSRGRVVGISKMTRDLTDRKVAEDRQKRLTAQLQQRNQELNNFAYLASHDLQEPLRSVTGFTRLLERRLQTHMDESALEMMGYVHEATGRMSNMIQALLEHSRLGRSEDFGRVDCNRLMDEIRVDMSSRIDESGAVIRHAELPSLRAGKTELRLLFQNLVDNAIKFARPDVTPTIDISAERQGEMWHFVFEDNGIGMDPDHSSRVFQIFQRLHAREDFDGTGIGLAHCRKIAALHGGTIELESVPGQGSRFHVTLDANAAGLRFE